MFCVSYPDVKYMPMGMYVSTYSKRYYIQLLRENNFNKNLKNFQIPLTAYHTMNTASYPTNHSQPPTDFFAEAFHNGPLKTISIAITLISLVYLVLSGFGIIWYEKYGSDKKRIIINRLLTSICWTGIEFYLVVIPVDVARYILGPLPELVCSFHLVLKNVITFQVTQFLHTLP